MFIRKHFENLWEGSIEPFKIIGNVYFVGTYSAAVYMIAENDALMLINPGRIETLHIVINSIYKLGFNPMDIKYILCTNWHEDYSGSVKAIQYMTKAKAIIGRKDASSAAAYFDADMTVSDGDTIIIGETKLEIIETPGFTEGSISFIFAVNDGRRRYWVGMFGGSDTETLKPGFEETDSAFEMYMQSIDRLIYRKVDVCLGCHVWNNDVETKGMVLKKTGENKFVDVNLWTDFLKYCKNKAMRVFDDDIFY